ncbi:hypothetical protein [Azospirillum thiophilum]|uniref:Uncharacterized protein n=1 Tax=Azospirillum thiophilum TaxID=528244 RepID=A0AAC8ZTH0_9PROT|nr:hypothetical protein [Azospirillum thiophilum]ALG69955.1 hypothetical protein AL072_02370 [Azospirillum thiophilum]
MQTPEPQTAPTAATAPGSTPVAAASGRSRWGRRGLRLGLALLLAPLAVAALGVPAVLWAGSRLYDQPFAWYNLNRIEAMAERAARNPDPVTVVALGDTALRDATLDEGGMAELAATRGVPNLEFLRIVHRQAQFADFEPLLDRLVALKPSLILIDRSLLTAGRGPVEELERYGRGLLRLARGQAYVQDQVALQYRRGCGPTPAAWLTGGTPDALAGSSAAARRVRAFIDRAWAAGIRVALIEVHSRPAPRPAGLISTASAAETNGGLSIAATANLPLWSRAVLGGGAPQQEREYAEEDDGSAGQPPQACADAPLRVDGRTAFSAWLTGGIAGAVVGAQPERMPGRAPMAIQAAAQAAPPVTEAASLP